MTELTSREKSGITRRLPEGRSARNSLLFRYKSGALNRGLSWELSGAQFDILTKSDCYYCGVASQQIRKSGRLSQKYQSVYVYNGIDRVDNSRGYEWDNVVSCCKVCNRAKDVTSTKEFLDWARRVADYDRRAVGNLVSEPSTGQGLSA